MAAAPDSFGARLRASESFAGESFSQGPVGVRALKRLLILIAPLLSACGTLSMGGLMHMHPSQEFCASRGLTLDPATKQCVTPPPPPHIAQAPPPPPVAPPPPPQQRLGPSVPIDPDAKIAPELQQNFDLMSELAHYVRASGYRCASISALQPLPVSRGYILICNHFTFRFNIEEKGDRWSVILD